MHTFLHYLLVAAAGGLATSSAEFKLDYNLVDLILDKIKFLVGLVKAGFSKAKSFVLGLPGRIVGLFRKKQ